MKINKKIFLLIIPSVSAFASLLTISLIKNSNNNLNYCLNNDTNINDNIYNTEKDEFGYIFVIADNIKYEINLNDQYILVKDVKNITPDTTEIRIKDSITFNYNGINQTLNVTKVADKHLLLKFLIMSHYILEKILNILVKKLFWNLNLNKLRFQIMLTIMTIYLTLDILVMKLFMDVRDCLMF